jgi:hypothetical protein
MISSAIIVGLHCASIHERVLEKVTNAFNKIVAFLIGAAATAWVWALLLGTYGSRHYGIDDLLGLWAGLGLALVVGIVVIGLTTTLADIREKLRSMESLPIPDPVRVSGGGRKIAHTPDPVWSSGGSLESRSIPEPVRTSPQSAAIEATSAYPSEPSLTDEEKAHIAQNLVKEAQLKARTKGVDEESKTDP